MLPLADLTDLNDLIPGGIDSDDQSRATALLRHASALVRAHCQQTFLTADGSALAADLPAAVVTVTVQCARRAFLNPDGVIATTVAGYSERLSEQAGQGLWLSDDERKMLDQATATGSTSGLWSQPFSPLQQDLVDPMFLVPTSATTGASIPVVPPEFM